MKIILTYIFIQFFLMGSYTYSQVDSIKSVAYLKAGLACNEREHYDTAVNYFDTAIQYNSSSWLAYRSKGFAEAHMGKYKQAIADLDVALSINSQDYFAFKDRAEAYRFYGYYDSAMADYDRVISTRPDDVSPYYGRGWILCNKLNKPKEALSDFDIFIGKLATWAPAFAERALANFNLKKYREAITDVNAYFKLQKSKIPAKYYNLYELRGKAFAMEKIADSAITDLTTYIMLVPKSASSYTFLGYAYSQIMDTAKARENFESGVSLDSDLVESLVMWGYAENKFKNYIGAKILFEEALQKTSAPTGYFLMNYALANGAVGNLDTSVLYYDKAILLDSSLAPQVYFQRVQLLISRIYTKKYNIVLLRDINLLMALAKTEKAKGELFFWKGVVESSLNFPQSKVLTNFDSAISITPGEPTYYLARAIINQDSTLRFKKQLTELEKAISLDEQQWQPFAAIAYLYSRHLNNRKEACRNMEKAAVIGGKENIPPSLVKTYCSENDPMAPLSFLEIPLMPEHSIFLPK